MSFCSDKHTFPFSMNEICPQAQCTGCAACAQSCAHGAVMMQVGTNGFMYPKIDDAACVDCGLCKNVCPMNADIKGAEPANVYLCWNRHDDIRIKSSSGGLFSVIASWIIGQGGVVCGAAYDDDMNVIHQIVDCEDGLDKLRGSKYVQSATNDCYKRIKDELKTDRWVYFVGTPCQVAGLRNYLRRDYEKLIISDLICHGVPSNDLFVRQIRQLEKTYGYKVKDFMFRSKKRFGQGCDLQVVTADGKSRFYNAELMPYFYGFWNNITLRPSCYVCRFANTRRVGDITLGDYWLAKKEFPDVKMSKGLSLALVNTERGQEVWHKISHELECRESTLQQAEYGQGQLKAPVARPKANIYYLEKYGKLDFNSCCQKFLTPPLKYKIKCHAKNAIKILIGFKYWK